MGLLSRKLRETVLHNGNKYFLNNTYTRSRDQINITFSYQKKYIYIFPKHVRTLKMTISLSRPSTVLFPTSNRRTVHNVIKACSYNGDVHTTSERATPSMSQIQRPVCISVCTRRVCEHAQILLVRVQLNGSPAARCLFNLK